MPLTMAEGMKVGQAWGRERGQAMIRELQQKGTLDAAGTLPGRPGGDRRPELAPKPGK